MRIPGMAVALIALLILLCSGAQAAPQRQKSANVLEYLTSRDDTLVFRGLLARFPYLQQLLADPKFAGTVFVPLDSSFPEGAPARLAAQLPLFETLTQPEPYWKEFLAKKCLWRALNQYIIPSKAVPRRGLVDGATFPNPLQSPKNTSLLVVRNSTGVFLGNTYFLNPEAGQFLTAKVTGSAAAGKAMVHAVTGWIPGGCADQGSTGFVSLFFPPGAVTSFNYTTNEYWESPALQSIDYPLVMGPWPLFMQPSLTMLRPSAKAAAAYFAANKALGSGPTTFEEVLSDKQLFNRFVGAHMIGGQRLWLWDFMNLGVLGSGQAQVTTLAGQAYNVTFVQDRATGYHQVFLKAPGDGKAIPLAPVREPGGDMWASLDCWGEPLCPFSGSIESGTAFEVDTVLME